MARTADYIAPKNPEYFTLGRKALKAKAEGGDRKAKNELARRAANRAAKKAAGASK